MKYSTATNIVQTVVEFDTFDVSVLKRLFQIMGLRYLYLFFMLVKPAFLSRYSTRQDIKTYVITECGFTLPIVYKYSFKHTNYNWLNFV